MPAFAQSGWGWEEPRDSRGAWSGRRTGICVGKSGENDLFFVFYDLCPLPVGGGRGVGVSSRLVSGETFDPGCGPVTMTLRRRVVLGPLA